MLIGLLSERVGGRIVVARALVPFACAAPQSLQRGGVGVGVLFQAQLMQLAFAQLVRQLGARGQKIAVGARDASQLGLQNARVLFGALHARLRLGCGRSPLGLRALQLFPAALQRAQVFARGGKGRIHALCLHLAANLIAPGGDEFAFRRCKLRLQLRHLGGGCLRALGRIGPLLFQARQLFAKLFQLLPAAEQPGRARHTAAGERAARVDNLAVPRDHTVAVAQRARHARGGVDVIHHHNAPQKV